LPHSKQHALERGVIRPQNGHIVCNREPLLTGLSVASSFANQSDMEANRLRLRIRSAFEFIDLHSPYLSVKSGSRLAQRSEIFGWGLASRMTR